MKGMIFRKAPPRSSIIEAWSNFSTKCHTILSTRRWLTKSGRMPDEHPPVSRPHL